jgi:hypothetical protein
MVINKIFNKKNLLAAGLSLAVFVGCFANGTSVLAQTTSVSTSTIINTADSEIDQRVQDLNDMILRIEVLKKISVAGQNGLTAIVQNEINSLTALKTQIDSETNAAAAKIDYQSITKSYRIYALVLPQTRIIAASDRILTITDSMNIISNKVKARIAGMTGTNSTTLNNELSDATDKIADAVKQSEAASNGVMGLQPDQGNTTKMQVNTNALKTARSQLQTASDDLVAARKDMGDIVAYLNESSVGTAKTNVASAPSTHVNSPGVPGQ